MLYCTSAQVENIQMSACPQTCSLPQNVNTDLSQILLGGLNVQTKRAENESEHGQSNVYSMLQNMSPCRVAKP